MQKNNTLRQAALAVSASAVLAFSAFMYAQSSGSGAASTESGLL